MRALSIALGVLLLIMVVSSVLRTLVVPRGLYSALVFRLTRSFRYLLRLSAAPLGTFRAMDRAQAWLAPLVLLGMLTAWLGGMLLAYSCLLYGLSTLDFGTAVREAGSSLFTLGFASGSRLKLSGLDFLAAASGPLIIALQIAYLPTLYGAYNRRETEVTLLESRAGEPAWGPELLARQWLVDTQTALPALYRDWERLAADIGESHSNYPLLLSFRSPRPQRSWIVSLLAVMDAAAIQLSIAPKSAPPEARLVLRAGFSSLRDIARTMRISFDPDPQPNTPIRLSFAEFDAAVAMIAATGFAKERPVEEAWEHFRGWRVNYESIAYELCRWADAVPALWTGPRDFPATPVPPRRPQDRQPAGRM
ncbi:hypothetical protein [Streptacidiphilus sp. MAP5-3]|uniref:hypothetical protein n=1 Tax=unclassified Streptacidiphilus TaxID=2643834 RepID=UPI0035166318